MNIFEILTIINTVLFSLIALSYARNNFPVYISVAKTFWKKIPHTINFMWITSRDSDNSMVSAKGIFHFTFRNIEKIEKIDKEYFRNKH